MESAQKKLLRAKAHSLKPVVITGNAGVTASVLQEIEVALDHHELIKVRVNAEDREQRKLLISEISERAGAELIQIVGHVATLHREKPKIR